MPQFVAIHTARASYALAFDHFTSVESLPFTDFTLEGERSVTLSGSWLRSPTKQQVEMKDRLFSCIEGS